MLLLCRLVFEIVQQQSGAHAKSCAAASSPAPLLGQIRKIASMTAGNHGTVLRVNSSVNRLFASSLAVVADYIQQMVLGVNASSIKSLAPPQEVAKAFVELEHFIISANAMYGLKLPSAAFDAEASAQLAHPSRFLEVLSAAAMQGQLRYPEYREILSESFAMHESLEMAMNSAVAWLTKALETENSKANAADGHAVTNGCGYAPKLLQMDALLSTMVKASLANTGSNAALHAVLGEMDFNVPISPYFEAMQTLASLAREEEVGVAQKILDRLLEESYLLGESLASGTVLIEDENYLSGRAASKLAKGGVAAEQRQEGTSGASGPAEMTVWVRRRAVACSPTAHAACLVCVLQELERLLQRGLETLKARIKRYLPHPNQVMAV